jgi:hypothetical protein
MIVKQTWSEKLTLKQEIVQPIAKGVKFFAEAVKEVGSVPALHKELLRIGVDISDTALYNVMSGASKSLKPEIIVAIVHVAFAGDWKRAGKLLEADYVPKAARK